jgi:ferrous iron transport protein B
MTLRDLKEGDKGVIVKIRGKGAFRKRIIEMGFVRGKQVTVIKAAPLQDPVEYRILDSDVSLRLEEAALIDVLPGAVSPDSSPSSFNGILEMGRETKNSSQNPKTIHVALVGNPNSGKTSLFNHASRSREHTGNYAGVTVDSKTAEIAMDGYAIHITDLPGTYSLTDYSPEELFVRQHLFDNRPDIVVNVVDASNLERNLYLTTQLIDMGVKVVVALNMYDELREKGDDLDYSQLGKMIGIPFVPTVASKGKGIRELFRKVIDVYDNKAPEVRKIQINYGIDLELAIERLTRNMLVESPIANKFLGKRFFAIKLLEKDKEAMDILNQAGPATGLKHEMEREIIKLENTQGEATETLFANARYGFIEGALKETYHPGSREGKSITQRIDQALTGKYMGYPIFILLMWLMFEATFFLGKYPVMAIEYGVDQLGHFVNQIVPEGMVNDMLIDGIIGGVGGVIVFLPNILILFLFISMMEDTGYMARVAFIVDKLMHRIGLHGKSFIPLLMGFGCNVPAIMATRTIESRSDRMVTMLIIPFMSCSARYPVYILLISAFFMSFRGAILFSLYLIGIFLAILVALIFKKTIFRAQEVPFVMELPPYRVPTVKSVMKHTWFKGVHYLRKMGTIILVASIVIWALGYFPRNPSLTPQQHQEQSYIGRLGKLVEPVIEPLGFDWRMGVSLIAGSAAKEVVVSTMGVLYHADGENGVGNLVERVKSQVHQDGPLAGQPVYTPLVAFALMVFILIYFPCIAVIAAVRKESGRWKWSAFLTVYTTVIAWLMAFLVYQAGSILQSIVHN